MSQFLRTSMMKMSVFAALALALSVGLLSLSGAPAHAQTVAAPSAHAAVVVKHQVATSQRGNWRGDYRRHNRRYGYGYGGYGYGGYGYGGYGYGDYGYFGGNGYGGYDGYGYGNYGYDGYGYGDYGY